MDTLLARYFDGELSDQEARDFLEAVDADPQLERELRAYERILALGKQLRPPKAPPGFTQRVMAGLETGGGVERTRWWRPFVVIRPAFAGFAAAVAIIAFIGGWWIARQSIPLVQTAQTIEEPDMTAGVPAGLVAVSANQPQIAQDGYRYVRLVYVPRETSVQSVQVAGDFNEWDPKATPLRRQDGVWSTVLVLPPGDYEYMFVVDEQRWVTDPLAVETRDDGFGGRNAVLEVEL